MQTVSCIAWPPAKLNGESSVHAITSGMTQMNMAQIIIVACILCLGVGCGVFFGPYYEPSMVTEEISIDDVPLPIRRVLQEQYSDAAVRGVLKLYFPPDIDSSGPSYLVRMQTGQDEQIERTLGIRDGAVFIADESGQVIAQYPMPSRE